MPIQKAAIDTDLQKIMHYTEEISTFIEQHKQEAADQVALKAKQHPDWPMAWIASQIAGWQTATHKVPSWAKIKELAYPARLSMEQCSSEATARFKANLFKGRGMADLTGGWGVDTYFMAQSFEKAYHIEQQQELHEIAVYNFQRLPGAQHIQCLTGNAEELLDQLPNLDLIYLDPARRDALQRKVFELSHCEPDITQLLPRLLQKAPAILLKASPMLDIPHTIRQLKKVQKVWAVSVKGECKEILFLFGENENPNPLITAVNLGTESMPEVHNHFEQEKKLAATLSEPQRFLYEPHAALLKAGLYNTICHRFQVNKLHPHSHLYTSQELREDFPGRKFQINEVIPYNKKRLKRALPKQANLSVRNFPQTVAKTRQQLQLKEGGSDYLFATTLKDGSRVVIWCEKA